jgi:hypothetical protein
MEEGKLLDKESLRYAAFFLLHLCEQQKPLRWLEPISTPIHCNHHEQVIEAMKFFIRKLASGIT